MQWYYSKNAAQLGPVSLDELRAKLASGEVLSTDMVWREGMPDWRPASAMFELEVPVADQQAAPTHVEVENPPYQASFAAQNAAAGMLIPNYLWQSIVVTIFCCWPLGIPAIVNAAKVDGMKARGDIHGAMEASASAKKWCWISLASWVVLFVICMIFGLIGAMFGEAQ
jgi:hypothetical protein